MSPSPRPVSAPSDLRKAQIEQDNAANFQRTFPPWTSTRGRRPELRSPQESPATVQIQLGNSGSNDEGISPTSQSTYHAQESTDGSTANHASPTTDRANPWEKKTLLTLGTVVIELSLETVLTLETDGGGVRGYSSLLILRELMKQIAVLEQHPPQAPCSVSPLDMRHRPSVASNHAESSHTEGYSPTRASSHYLPCHYFDYIAGTSTGGCTHFTHAELRSDG